MSCNRNAVYEYAKKWAYGRNPKYYDYVFAKYRCVNIL